jgi:mannose-6-phosphate isomerase-like protein (cupin superfamily)
MSATMPAPPAVFDLSETPLHLGLGATAIVQPPFTGGMAWYEGYGARHAVDGVEGRLVTVHTFAAPWDVWEVHPHGDEVVVCLAGTLTLHQEIDGRVSTVTLRPLQGIVNPPGVWHTADVSGSVTALFITAGLGTDHRPR